MSKNFLVGTGPVIIKRFILTEGAGFTIPPNASILYSEVVANEDGDEILELWLAVPTNNALMNDDGSGAGRTIYSRTTIHEDDDVWDKHSPDDVVDNHSEDWSVPPLDEHSFRQQIEQDVANNLINDEDDDYEY